MWVAVVLVWLALIAGVIWFYQRKLRSREAERNRQYDVFLTEVKRGGAPATAGVNPVAAQNGAAAVARPGTPSTVAPPVAEFARKERLLPQPQALLYYVFRTGLPDHEIFAGLTLADVIDVAPSVAGYEREQKARRLARERLDLVVCSKQLEVVAAVMVANRAAAAQPADADFAAQCLQTAGIRLVKVDAAALPRHQQVRDLVYGATQ